MTIGHAIERPDWGEYLSPEWIASRSQYLGASDVPAVLGVDPDRGPWEAWALKVGRLESEPATEVMELGLDMEPVIRRRWERGHPEAGPVRQFTYTFQHPRVPCLGASLDGIVTHEGRDAVFEAKHLSARQSGEIRLVVDGAQPEGRLLRHWIQVQAQLAVTGMETGILAIFHDKTLSEILVPRDERAVAHIEQECAAFWVRFIEGDEEPRPGAIDARALRRAFPVAEPGRHVDAPDLAPVVEKARDIKAILKEQRGKVRVFERELAEQEAILQARMRDAEIMTAGDGKPVVWKTTHRKGYKVEPTTYRKLRY